MVRSIKAIYNQDSGLMKPTEIKRLNEGGLEITWDNGEIVKLFSKTLRELCPCALCKEQRGDTTHSKPLTGKPTSLKIVEHSKDEALSLKSISAVGTYAISIRWGDGHDTGIYTFPYLYELSKKS